MLKTGFFLNISSCFDSFYVGLTVYKVTSTVTFILSTIISYDSSMIGDITIKIYY